MQYTELTKKLYIFRKGNLDIHQNCVQLNEKQKTFQYTVCLFQKKVDVNNFRLNCELL